MYNMILKKKIKFIKQLDSNDCGLACLAMALNYFGKNISLNQLKTNANLSSEGITIENLTNQASQIQIELIPLSIKINSLNKETILPAIIFWEQNHFLIIEKISSKFIYLIDPAFGRCKMQLSEFYKGWLINNEIGKPNINEKINQRGILLLLNPMENFDSLSFDAKNEKLFGWAFIKQNFLIYKEDNLRILLSLLVVSLLQLLLPFSNQLIVDYGIQYKNISFIYIIALCISLFYILIAINEFLRSWSLTYLSTKINYKLISKFLKKITALPIKTIYSRKIGDYIERIHDHKKLEEYFSDNVIRSLFAIVSIFMYGIVLYYFSYKIFFIVLLISFIELVWIFRFLNALKALDNKIFGLNAQDQDKVYEILSNLPDIKLNNIEEDKNKEWQFIQTKLFNNYLKKLKLNQIEQGGSKILSALQLFSITVVSAIFVTNGEITIGMMFSIIFIVNQLNYPISHLINFVINTQIVSNSFQRIFEIHNLQEEDTNGIEPVTIEKSNIIIKNLSFSYNQISPVLKDISFTILHNKTTAIVGYSGSGKTTLLKLLLKFYDDYSGSIIISNGEINLKDIKSSYWRNNCGAVLQESSVYSESIAYNIALKTNENIDKIKLNEAIQLSCLAEYVNELPLGVLTKLTSNGATLSSGQKQRLLIARLIYKNPSFVFLDEATNSLDANTELSIINNLTNFFKNKTVVIVAHRLSTVKNADQILVINKGVLLENGTHSSLINSQGEYFNLIKNQLELENEK
jgi:ATP-binding cassette, subfamily B, bacterial